MASHKELITDRAAGQYRHLAGINRATGGSVRLLLTLDRLDQERLQPPVIIEPLVIDDNKSEIQEVTKETVIDTDTGAIEHIIYKVELPPENHNGHHKKSKKKGRPRGHQNSIDPDELLAQFREIQKLGGVSLPRRPHRKPR